MIFYRTLREITFRLTNVIPEWIIFVSRGITVLMHVPSTSSCKVSCSTFISKFRQIFPKMLAFRCRAQANRFKPV